MNAQADISTSMARHLESLAAHYDQMAGALRDSEAGEVYTEEDMQGSFLPLSLPSRIDLIRLSRCRDESRHRRTAFHNGRVRGQREIG